ncbi:MAG TPA: hypothetical protein VFY40_02275 [Blastocatellia bacterium]|nr:hypothetical protein [Blastocatellia bacterium]
MHQLTTGNRGICLSKSHISGKLTWEETASLQKSLIFRVFVVVPKEPHPYEKAPEPKITIKRPISFNSEERLAPGEAVSGDFFMEEYRRATIDVRAECKDYVEGSLRISLLDGYNYRVFESGQPYDVIDTIGANFYNFSNGLERGLYFIVIQNTSDVQEIVIKVHAILSYEVDNPSYYIEESGQVFPGK